MGRAFLVLSLLLVLLFGPAFGGVTAWIHSHCHAGGHVHLIQDGRVREVVSLVEWHDAEHRHDHELEGLGRQGHAGKGHDEGEHDGSTPRGLLIEVPEFLAALPRGSTGIPGPQTLPPSHFRLPLELAGEPPRAGWIRSGGPPRGAERSGVVALLRSSHAIRI